MRRLTYEPTSMVAHARHAAPFGRYKGGGYGGETELDSVPEYAQPVQTDVAALALTLSTERRFDRPSQELPSLRGGCHNNPREDHSMVHKHRTGFAAALMSIVMLGLPISVQAQDKVVFPLPGKPVSLIGNFAPGGVVGKAMQDFQPFFEKELGGPVTIETIEGAAGLIGYNTVFSRPADGYSILPSSSTFGPYIYPHLSETKPPWKYEDWRPLGIYSDIPNSGMVVLKNSPYKTFTDVIKAAKEKPGKITIGTIGPGRVEDVQIIELEKFFGVDVNRVFYDSGGTLFTDLLTGDLDVIITAAIQYAENPDVRIITILAKEMTPNFPYQNLKTMADWQKDLNYNVKDLKTLGSTQFNGLMVKAGLPEPVYQRLVEVFKKVVTNPEWKERVKSYRFPVYYPPEEAKKIYDELNEGIAQMVADTKGAK
jgi:tripartite-type tricarboxylate transporter receptor subunit TctC